MVTKERRSLHPIVHIIIMTCSFVLISVVVVFYALGYQVNWATKSIQQTGSLVLDSAISGIGAEIYIDNALAASSFPLKRDQLFPGQYQVEIKKPGYQTWQRTLQIDPNKVANYRHIMLIKDPPTELKVGENERVEAISPDRDGISIRVNELWVNDKLLTRSSEDINSARWYFDHNHIIYQAGRQLLLIEVDAGITHVLLNLPSKSLLEYNVKNDGQVLLYRLNGEIKKVELFTRN